VKDEAAEYGFTRQAACLARLTILAIVARLQLPRRLCGLLHSLGNLRDGGAAAAGGGLYAAPGLASGNHAGDAVTRGSETGSMTAWGACSLVQIVSTTHTL
jgi:hypothetical protein